jgi:acyl-CoA synthetase (AMP-forming)/AMP-acid ligase II
VHHTLPDQLRTMAERFADEIGYQNLGNDSALTFRRWDETSNRLARTLVADGIAPGDRVSVFLPPEQVLEWLIAYAAVHKAGAVAVPTNTRLVARELQFILDHCEAAGIVTNGALAGALPDVASLRVRVDADTWEDVLDPDDGFFQVDVGEDDLADIMYTSGTTGRPKGVAVRHRNVAMMPHMVPAWTGAGWMHSSPLFTFAGIASTYNPMKLGMTGLFLPKFDAGRFLELVERERPVAVFIVPAMAQLLIAHPRFAEADLGSIGLCSLGSAPLAPETLRTLQRKMPDASVNNGYGMTEAGPAFCSMPKEEAGKRVGSVGRPVPPVEFSIVDDDGNVLPAGSVGEVRIRKPGQEREYYRDPEATANMWKGGWLHSGDLGHLDEDGYLYIVGRKKDVIIRGGNNVHATDVEAALFEHPAVREAAVAGIPHDVLGEDVAAWIVVRDGHAVDGEELRAFVAERLSDYKVPRRYTFVAELPRNATGKVVKSELVKGS